MRHVRDSLQHLTNEEVRHTAIDWQLPFAIAIPNFSALDPNPGNIIRTACAFGVQDVFMFGRRKYDRRTTIGTHHYVNMLSFSQDDAETELNWAFMLQTIRLHDYTPVLIEQGGTPIHRFDPTVSGPICLVFGSEYQSIPDDVSANEQWYSITQPGVGRSLNTAVAASIAMHHVVCCLHTFEGS